MCVSITFSFLNILKIIDGISSNFANTFIYMFKANTNNKKLRAWGQYFWCYLYPRHLCRGVYSFRLSVRPFVCSYVRSFVCSFVRSFVLPSVAWNLRQSFALKFLKWCISQQLLIRKHSYLDHSYPGGLAFTP